MDYRDKLNQIIQWWEGVGQPFVSRNIDAFQAARSFNRMINPMYEAALVTRYDSWRADKYSLVPDYYRAFLGGAGIALAYFYLRRESQIDDNGNVVYIYIFDKNFNSSGNNMDEFIVSAVDFVNRSELSDDNINRVIGMLESWDNVANWGNYGKLLEILWCRSLLQARIDGNDPVIGDGDIETENDKSLWDWLVEKFFGGKHKGEPGGSPILGDLSKIILYVVILFLIIKFFPKGKG